jgi:hypothetical protein
VLTLVSAEFMPRGVWPDAAVGLEFLLHIANRASLGNDRFAVNVVAFACDAFANSWPMARSDAPQRCSVAHEATMGFTAGTAVGSSLIG